MNRWWASVVVLLVVVLGALWLGEAATTAAGKPTTWTDLKDMIESDEITNVVFERTSVKAQKTDDSWVRTGLVEPDTSFVALLESHDIPYGARTGGCNDPSVAIIPILLLPLLFMGLFWFWMARSGGPGRATAFGRSTAQMVPEEGTGVCFDDLGGVDEAVEELKEVTAFLQTPEKFTSLGGRPPKGVLLIGPPGTGKTLLARAVAGEAQVPFFQISGSSFVEMFVGVGAARVRDLFKQAELNAPCIIFVDELDAVGRARGTGPSGGNEEREQTLNQLLVEMDGFDNRGGIIVMAATNRPEILDRALLRAGRFDRQVLVDRPDLKGRADILAIHAKKITLSDSVNLKDIARMTPGFAGADLANILNEAALLAARRESAAIDKTHVEEAIERVVAGLEKKNRRLSVVEKRTVAYHECGHAICAASSPGADPVQKISIIPRGVAALGYTIQMPLEDRYLMSKAELLNRITVLFGGRAAEQLIFGDVTTGAADDIQKATDLARRMITEYGMSTKVGTVHYGSEPNANPFGMGGGFGGATMSPHTAEIIEAEVRALIDRCYARSLDMLQRNRVVLEEMTAALLEEEVLDGELMQKYLGQVVQAESLSDPPTSEIQR